LLKCWVSVVYFIKLLYYSFLGVWLVVIILNHTGLGTCIHVLGIGTGHLILVLHHVLEEHLLRLIVLLSYVGILIDLYLQSVFLDSHIIGSRIFRVQVIQIIEVIIEKAILLDFLFRLLKQFLVDGAAERIVLLIVIL